MDVSGGKRGRRPSLYLIYLKQNCGTYPIMFSRSRSLKLMALIASVVGLLQEKFKTDECIAEEKEKQSWV